MENPWQGTAGPHGRHILLHVQAQTPWMHSPRCSKAIGSCLGTSGANTSLPRQLGKFFPLFSLYTSLALLAPPLAVTQSCARGSRRGSGLLDLLWPAQGTEPCPVPEQPQELHTDSDQAQIKLLAKRFPGAGVGDGTGTLWHPVCSSLCPSLPSPEVLLWGCHRHQCPCPISPTAAWGHPCCHRFMEWFGLKGISGITRFHSLPPTGPALAHMVSFTLSIPQSLSPGDRGEGSPGTLSCHALWLIPAPSSLAGLPVWAAQLQGKAWKAQRDFLQRAGLTHRAGTQRWWHQQFLPLSLGCGSSPACPSKDLCFGPRGAVLAVGSLLLWCPHLATRTHTLPVPVTRTRSDETIPPRGWQTAPAPRG